MKQTEKQFKIAIGTNIKRLREGKGIRQQAMADILGITAPAYSKVESGTTDPSIYRLLTIAKTLDAPLHAIIDHPLVPKGDAEIEEIRKKYNEANEKIIQLQSKLLNKQREDKLRQ